MKIINFKIILTIFFALFSLNNAFAGSDAHIRDIETHIPEYVWKLAWNYINDIQYRKQGLLEQDRYFNEYLVIPSNGLVIPINKVQNDSSDFSGLINFENVNINKYLQNWSLVFPTTKKVDYWETWNITIMWHSSYLKNDSWRYKTHFQLIIWLEKWKEIWVFKNTYNWEFKRYKYIITESYETVPEDISVLNHTNKKEITLFTCTPIWWVWWRWIIKSEYLEEFAISKRYKDLLEKNIIAKINNMSDNNKKLEIINSITLKINRARVSNIQVKNILLYLKQELKKISLNI